MKTFLIAAAVLMTAGAANAATIDFEELPAGNCNYLGSSTTSQGYVFSSSQVYTCEPGGVGTQNTTRALIGYSFGQLSFARENGAAFSLNSLFTGNAQFYNSGTTGASVTGNLIGGGQVAAVLDFDGYAFKQYDFSSAFTGLSSVTLQLFGPPGSGNSLIMIDNLVVDEAADVPEPAMLGLFGLGLLGLARLRRRRAA
ncbi:MAG: PEP-CTERM sorting domain-containing protein [Sphingomonadaceae bacterium]|nr:PEP-CTERM sorting domain-containing protein [Sphingomonadaceae bacterium]